MSLSMYEQVTVGLEFNLDELPFQRKTSVLVEFGGPNGFMTLAPTNDQINGYVDIVQENADAPLNFELEQRRPSWTLSRFKP